MARPKMIQQFEPEILLNERTRSVSIRRLEIKDPEFYEIISEQEEPNRPRFIERSLRIGAIALRDVGITEKIDYVKREFQKLCTELDTLFTKELGAEGMKGALDNIFGCNGKLARDILDINNKKSPVGQLRETIESYFVGKDSQVYAMLDPTRKDSPMALMKQDIMDELEKIRTRIEEQIVRKAIIEKTPQKGFDFEDTLEDFLQQASKPFGDTIERAGKEKGKLGNLKGDFVITINDPRIKGKPPRIAVEAKTGENLQLTKKGLLGDLDGALENREAKFAVAVTERAFSDAVGYYREMEGNKIICAFEDNGLPLEVAYKVARASILLNMYKETETQIDTTKITDLINKINNDLSTFRGIKAKLTNIGKTSEDITYDIKNLETGIRETLAEIHENLRTSTLADNNQKPLTTDT